jgi:hypothetical protein
MTEDGFAALREHPAFRNACDAAARTSVAHFRSLDAPFQWIMKDIGRSTICTTALTLDFQGNLTVQNLTAFCVENQISSSGRVSEVVRRCQGTGQIIIDEGSGMWTRRPAHVGRTLANLMCERWMADLAAALTMEPELDGALALAATDLGYKSFMLTFARTSRRHRDIFAFGRTKPLDFFLEREAGMLILLDLMASQPAERARLLQAAPISRNAISRRYGVSRAHINKLLADSGHTDAIRDRVFFSRELSDSLERHFSIIFRFNIGYARALLTPPANGAAAVVSSQLL